MGHEMEFEVLVEGVYLVAVRGWSDWYMAVVVFEVVCLVAQGRFHELEERFFSHFDVPHLLIQYCI